MQRSERPITIVAISSLAPIHRFVITTVAQHFPVAQVLETNGFSASAHHNRFSKIKRFAQHPFRMLAAKLNERLMRSTYRRVADEIARRLPPPACNLPTFPIPINEINSPTAVGHLKQLQPDILLVSGAPILSQEVINTAKLAAINVHFGIAPTYRGENTIFFALLRRDHEHLGMTIHRISQRIDGGALLSRGWPALNGNESEADLWAKGGIMAARMLIELLSHVQSIRTSCDAKEADLKCNELLAGVHQSEKGKLYLFRERTFVRQCWYEWFARTQFPARAERVEWFTPPMSQPPR